MSSTTSDPTSEKAIECQRADGVTAGPPSPRRSRAVYWWITAFVLFVLFLGALAYAETVVLHRDLPQDRASRVALIAFPGRGSPAWSKGDWDRRLAQNATDPQLLQEIIDRMDLRDAASGDPLTPARLRASMTVDSQCVEVSTDHDQTSRGMLLVTVIRGSSADSVERIAKLWTDLILQRSATMFPGLTIQPVETFGGTYEICR